MPAPPVLPDGPRASPVAQAVAFHRDPLGFLPAQQARHGLRFVKSSVN